MHTRTHLSNWLLGGLLALAAPAQAQLQLSITPYTSGLSLPVAIAHAGTDRLYVVEKAGRIRIVEPGGALLPNPFLDIRARVRATGNEQGLLGVAFHPNYAANGYFYVNYTDTNGDTRIERFERSATNPDSAGAASGQVLLTIPQPFTNHNGGCVQFGPDGYLYIGTGDGGSAGDPGNRAQDLTQLLGKMLRIDVDTTSPGLPYGIPPSNPFASAGGLQRPEIWAWGLRNPWRFSFDRQTGDLWIGDVGQGNWEEIDVWPASLSSVDRNFGWRCYEGTHTYNTAGCAGATNYVPPIFEYSHALGQSVTGGFVYRGTQYPALAGHYVFTDYGSGNFWTTVPDGAGAYTTVKNTALTQSSIVSFGEDGSGELYCARISSGSIYRVGGTNPTGITAEAAAAGFSVAPNPASGSCHVTLPAGATGPVALVSLVTGQTLRRAAPTAGIATLDLRELPAGLYAVRATTGQRALTARVMVE